MKKYIIMFMCLSALFFAPKAFGVESNEDLRAKVAAMEKMLMELKGQLEKQVETSKAEKEEIQAIREEVKGIMPGNEFYWAQKAQELKDKGLAPTFGGVETKSFLRRMGRNTLYRWIYGS